MSGTLSNLPSYIVTGKQPTKNSAINLGFLYLEYQLQVLSLLPKQYMQVHKRFKTTKDDKKSGEHAEWLICMRDEE